ncbi:MAG: hypothetical protein NC417_01790 [Candidatus Gastranaerophilales bacterium]|nr:hypothetical protein [Candidatus Gastranaerophilales bacterium]
MGDMRDKHLTAKEIMKYIDASDLSEDYLLWMEEAAEHIQACDVCQERLHRAMIAESVCEEEGLAAGLKLLEYEEAIRKNILIAHLSRMREQEKMAELIGQIRDGYIERFAFSMADLRRSAGAVRGAAPQCGQQVTLEKSEDKLLLRISGEMGKENRTGTAEVCSKITVILRMEDGEPIVKEALWDETSGQYVAVVDGDVRGEMLEVYLWL